MITLAKLVNCNRCGNEAPLYADDGVYDGGVWYVTGSCPTCGDKKWTAIRDGDDNTFLYEIGDTPLTVEPEYDWDWTQYDKSNQIGGK